MSEIELMLILSLYYFDQGKGIDSFTKRFNQYFNRDVSTQTMLYAVTKFRNVDPSFNASSKSIEGDYNSIWTNYIGKGRTKELKELYLDFKRGLFVKPIISLIDQPQKWSPEKTLTINLSVTDTPVSKPGNLEIKGLAAYPRCREMAANALNAANYQCENGCGAKLFMRKDGATTYTEAHHLIPLCFQDEFEYSLDVEANIISLCPSCHCQLHYGFNIGQHLMGLYIQRKNRLKACGISISFEKLLLLYRTL